MNKNNKHGFKEIVYVCKCTLSFSSEKELQRHLQMVTKA